MRVNPGSLGLVSDSTILQSCLCGLIGLCVIFYVLRAKVAKVHDRQLIAVTVLLYYSMIS